MYFTYLLTVDCYDDDEDEKNDYCVGISVYHQESYLNSNYYFHLVGVGTVLWNFFAELIII